MGGELHYADDGLEIGGVNGAIEDWREILLPLLYIEKENGKFRGTLPKKTQAPTSLPSRRRGRRS